MQTKTSFEGTQHSPETEIEAIEITIKQAKEFVAMRDDLAKLSRNPAFKRVFLEGYLKDAPVRLTGMLGHPAHKDHQDDIISDLKGIAAFKEYCDMIFRKGDEAAEAIREHELALDEITADASEEFEGDY